jgi:NhaA family Na+:H+ antiporter
MSLFIGSLAFEETTVNMLFNEKLGIIISSVASGFSGYLILNTCLGKGVSEEKI